MNKEPDFPLISTELDLTSENHNHLYYSSLVPRTLKQILPSEFIQFYGSHPDEKEKLFKHFQSLLPFTYWKPTNSTPTNMSCYLICCYRPNAFKFFFEMISRWLIPGKRLNVLAMYASDFTIPEFSEQVYTMCEMVIRIENAEEMEAVKRNLPIIESEVRLGVVSSYYARRILEVKGLSNDEKTAMIQECIAWATARWPHNFSFDVFTEMQHVLVMCRDDFKLRRSVRHLSRLIGIQYLFRKDLRQKIRKHPGKRHLNLKFFQTTLLLSDSEKKVLGVLLAVNFLRDKEVFEETHLIKAIQNYIPEAVMIENSSFFNRRGAEPICTLYLEVEKQDGKLFTASEVTTLRNNLPKELGERVEHLIQPVFMPRNEEEIMRNILTLGNQIKYLRDIPQVFITFDEQTHHHLCFNVIIVRVLKEGDSLIEESFKNSSSRLEYIHDRTKTIGFLRKKYPKEATVCRLRLPKEEFLRRDHSIDLYKAREAVFAEVSNALGEVRDYNGGMISKQNELLASVRKLLQGIVNYNDLLLEDFFYSLNPVIMRTVLEPEALKTLFVMLLESISDGFFNEESYAMKVRAEPHFVYVMITAEHVELEELISEELALLDFSPSSLAMTQVNVYDILYLGYIFRSDDPQKQRKFCISIQHAIEKLEHQR
ncbi:hypothetical protein [Waddlia chondrophila]|nr:hypothetical protein [Waddlia chondrophila]